MIDFYVIPIQKTLLVGLLHHLEVLLDVTVEDLAAEGLFGELDVGWFVFLFGLGLFLLFDRLDVLGLGYSEFVFELDHFLGFLDALVAAQVGAYFL